MKRQIYAYFFVFFIVIFLLTFLFRIVRARVIIWQVGQLDDSYNEFIFSDKRVIDYQVPSDWQSISGRDDPDWGEFPSFLYTDGNEEHPREIRINFDYLEDYHNPVLLIRVTTLSVDPNHNVDPNQPRYLELFKGERDVFIDKRAIEDGPFYPYKFSTGYIEQGTHKENMLILRSNGPSGTPVVFDTVFLYYLDGDSDGDGVSDADEGDFYKDNNSVVSIPLKSYHPDPLFKKRIILCINESEEPTPCFRVVKFLDPVVLNLPERLITGRYLPYECLHFKLEDIGTQEKIAVQIRVIDQPSPSFYPSVRFHTYQDANDWQETDFELLDGNTAVISLNDKGVGDYDGEKNGIISTILTVSYPESLDVQAENGSCFIKAVHRRRDYGANF